MDSFEQLKLLKLTERERDERKAAILEYMLAHPFERKAAIFREHRILFAGAAMLILLFAGAVTLGERALPGDLSYLMKIEVTEHVIDAVTVTNEGQMDWDVAKAERRQYEVEQLASELGI